MNRTLAGLIAGFAATAPMTAAMAAMHRRLPPEERYPLPPYEITMEVAERADVEERLDPPERAQLTMAAHFSYGALCGALYPLLSDRLPGPPAARGTLFGLAVWAGSYLGWLPAAGILRPATEHPGRRNALMVAAHVVWGSTLGLLADRLDGQR